MNVSIVSFLFVFITAAVFFAARRAALRAVILLAASYLYAAYLSPYTAAALAITSILFYGAGLLLDHLFEKESTSADIVTGICIGAGLAVLVFYKYGTEILPQFVVLPEVLSSLVIPVGFSFYLFQGIGYLMDIRSGRIAAIHNPVIFLLTLAWFPKFVSGPIERTDNLEWQMRTLNEVPFLDAEGWAQSILYILYGLFLKLCIADRLSGYVDTIFDAQETMTGLWKIVGSLFYTIQIYADFAGYSYMAVGISLIFGIRLMTNFNIPYGSANITEFWRRWHISLSSWFRDYLYIPLGGNRKGKARKVLNVLIVFTLCGLWHGNGLSFLVWGLLHGLYNAFDLLASSRRWKWVRSGITGRILTFCAVSFAWIFFRADTLEIALSYIRGCFCPGSIAMFRQLNLQVGIDLVEAVLIGVFLAILLFTEVASYRSGKDFPSLVNLAPVPLRCFAVYLMIVVTAVFGVYGGGASTGYIYMGF